MINSRKIEDLRLIPAAKCRAFIAACAAAGVDVIITSTFLDAESQNALYAQGRTAPGKRVTNARCGDSLHNWRVAFDFVPVANGKAIWGDAKLWERFSRIITDASTGNLVKYKYTLEKNSNLFVRVINPMQGVVYKETVPNHPQGEFMKTIPFATLPKGRYLLIVRSNRKVILRQMIINK